MTTKSLIEYLTKLPEDVEVLLASDPEGNSFHSVDQCEAWFAYPGTTQPVEEEEADDNSTPVVILWPV